MPAPKPLLTEVAGRTLKVTNLDKVLYPMVEFRKAQVIEYYVTIAPAMLTHIKGRGITFKRWPDGVTAEPFFNKRAPDHRPDWVGTCRGPGDKGKGIDYPVLDEVAALAWSANLAALEIHAPMARCVDIDSPTILVFDLDPGKGTSVVECSQVALLIAEMLNKVGLESFAKTSGSKGLQMYIPLNTPHTTIRRATSRTLLRSYSRRTILRRSPRPWQKQFGLERSSSTGVRTRAIRPRSPHTHCGGGSDRRSQLR